MRRLLSFSILLIIKIVAHLLYSFVVRWVGEKPEETLSEYSDGFITQSHEFV